MANPSFTIGSNYFETVHAYPHDLLKWPDSGVFVSLNPQSLPWQGDVTNISNRPSESYTSNYQEVDFAPPSDYTGNPEDIHSWMRVSSYASKFNIGLGGLSTSRFGKILVELNHTSLDMDLTAEGVARAYEDAGGGTEYYLVPFAGQTKSGRSNYGLKVIYANRFYNNPFGFKLRYTDESYAQPSGYIQFTREGTTYDLNHLTWGWATTGCNHIFGYQHINADAFFQDRYTVFSGHRLDLQFSGEFNGNFKSGIRYRRNQQDGDNYTWRYDDGSQFEGDYYVDELWKDRHANTLLRGYSKVNFWKIGEADAGILFFLQRATHVKTEVNKVVESEPNSREGAYEIAIETNPFLNYRFHGGYLDIGILLEYARSGMENTWTRWNSVSGSEQEDVLWSTTPYSGWTPSWESFSKGSESFFATGFEADTSIPLRKRLSALLRLTVLRKFTWTDKVYGQSDIPPGGESYQFEQTHIRDNYRNETWMTGSIGMAYGKGPIQTFVTLQLPVAYLIKQETKLQDSSEVLFEHEKRNMWQVQDPTSLRLLVVYNLGS
jgi:hypothetical protein